MYFYFRDLAADYPCIGSLCILMAGALDSSDEKEILISAAVPSETETNWDKIISSFNRGGERSEILFRKKAYLLIIVVCEVRNVKFVKYAQHYVQLSYTSLSSFVAIHALIFLRILFCRRFDSSSW